MGVYVFRSRHGPYIKVGHYNGQNAYSRVAHRGFYSCACPREIRERVSVGDVELVAWHPSLTRSDETAVKKRWKAERLHKSEWYPGACEEAIRAFLAAKEPDQKEACDLAAAVATRKRL